MAGKEHMDELILKARQAREKMEEERHSKETVEEELKQSIYDETVQIFGVPVSFQDMEVLGGKAVMRMPEDFIPRTEEEIASVYMLGTKPQQVFSNGYLDFMVALNWTENLIPDGSIFDFTGFAKQAIERVGPKAQFSTVDKLSREDGSLAIMQFTAQTIDSVNYNVMFFVSLEERLTVGSITFDQKYRKRLLPLALEMAKSFHIMEKVGKEDEYRY